VEASFDDENEVVEVRIVKTDSIRCRAVLYIIPKYCQLNPSRNITVCLPCENQVGEPIVDLRKDQSIYSLSTLARELTPPATSPPAIGPIRKDMRDLVKFNSKADTTPTKKEIICNQNSYLFVT